MTFSMKLTGVVGATRMVRDVPIALKKNVITSLAADVYALALVGAKSHSKSGKLVASLVNRPVPNGRAVEHDPLRAPHAVYVHYGTKPHDIRPKRVGGKLRFIIGGRVVFAKRVRHPGYRGDPYFTRAVIDGLRTLPDIVSRVIKGIP